MLGRSLAITLVGTALGLAGATALTRYLKAMLFGLTPLDPATFVSTAVAFAGIVTLAAFVAARAAIRADPLAALRNESQ